MNHCSCYISTRDVIVGWDLAASASCTLPFIYKQYPSTEHLLSSIDSETFLKVVPTVGPRLP